MSPLGGTIELALSGEEAADRGIEVNIDFLATLLHERHHWLQHVGTTTGMFTSMLLEIQSDLTFHFLSTHRLSSSDLPLVTSQHGDDKMIFWWEQIEATRRLYMGSRMGDFNALVNDGRVPMFLTLSKAMLKLLDEVSPCHPRNNILSLWDVEHKNEVADHPVMLRLRGWNVGSRHLMECSARLTEMFKLLFDRARFDGYVDLEELFGGIYGIVREAYYRIIKIEVSLEADIALMVICDLALNTPDLPPLSPLAGEAVHRGSTPLGAFLLHVDRLRSFQFGSADIDVCEPESVSEFAGRVVAWVLGDSKLTDFVVSASALSVMGDLSPDMSADSIFTARKNRLPRPNKAVSRFTYLASLSARAFKIRMNRADIFYFPFAQYAQNRGKFHDLFDQVQPPLVRYGSDGIRPTRSELGWLEFFTSAMIQCELARGIYMFDIDELASRLAVFSHSALGIDHGGSVMVATIYRTVGAPLSDQLVEKMSELLGA
jgi:hypothetical protein